MKKLRRKILKYIVNNFGPCAFGHKSPGVLWAENSNCIYECKRCKKNLVSILMQQMNDKIKEELITHGASPEFLQKIEDMNDRMQNKNRDGLSIEEYQTYRDYCERLVNWTFKK